MVTSDFENLNPMQNVNSTNAVADVQYAGFWKRVYSNIIDGFILSLITIPLAIIAYAFFLSQYHISSPMIKGNYLQEYPEIAINLSKFAIVSFLISYAIQLIYFSAYISSADQATPGMKIHSQKIGDLQGRRISFMRALGRELLSFISFWALCVGYIMMGFTKRKQTLHDVITGTYVMQASEQPSAELQISQHYTNFRFAGFWRRVGASLIDRIILVIFALIIGVGVALLGVNDEGYIFDSILTIILLAIEIFYFAWFTSSRFQATLGKKLFSMKVIDIQGNRLSFGRACIRYFSTFISAYTLLIGFIMVAFTKRKQGLHDKIANTNVIYVPKIKS